MVCQNGGQREHFLQRALTDALLREAGFLQTIPELWSIAQLHATPIILAMSLYLKAKDRRQAAVYLFVPGAGTQL